jgi:16S rRNA (cytosine967-C5)-methyltransferase
VYACDVSAARLSRMRERLARSGATNVQPFGIDSEHDPKLERLAGRADAVLVDAPCSGTGTLRRNPDMKWRFDPVSLPALGATQRSILKAAAALVKPGGTLVYATCSLLPEENDAVRADFERDHPDWRQQPAGALLAAQGIALADPGAQALALRPDRDGSDGFYAVRWQRPA